MSIPYFYIIKHLPSNKLYAGARWGKDCHPSELLQENGYLTSSSAIHKMIEDDGLNSFVIEDIIEISDPYEYETQFLMDNNCANSDMWINKHNNICPPAFGTPEFAAFMVEKYGVVHNTQIESVLHTMTQKQKEYWKNNPEQASSRAKKAAKTARERGTNGPGVPKTKYTNNGNNGKYNRTEQHKQILSEVMRKTNEIHGNPMDNPIHRAKISAMKTGCKRYINEQGVIKMYRPEVAPEGFTLCSPKTKKV